MTSAKAERPLDVVVWGATGFTGKLVAEYLARRAADEGIRWAIGGRNRDKLEAVRRDLAVVSPAAAEVPLEVADAHDLPALRAIAARTRVVASTAGPFATHGSDLVAACVEQGTDYCDITGEVHWVRRMADAHHAAAEKNGARIVCCCGFDSIPSDLGVLMVQEHARQRFGQPCNSIRYFLGENKGSMSGGTVASMLALLDEARRDRAVRRVLGDPYALDPPGGRRGPDGSDQHGVRHDPDVGWTGPFVMAAVNTRIVRRSNALLGYPYGEGFRYSEAMSFPPGPRGLLWASGITAGVAAFALGATVGPLRKVFEARLPAPGTGPSREARERGHFKVRLFGTFDQGAGPKLLGEVAGHNDPGYGETAKMLGESALCLARDPAPGLPGGLLTTASSMGMRLVERLRAAGMTFEVRER
ncbi:MAG: saccharopine dehydrogenase NADP-binding domain-containing protein [Polyangiaceae bacterium]